MTDDKGVPDQRRDSIAFSYNGHDVTFDANRFIDVTEMWRAVGSPRNKEFWGWKRKEGASFVRDLAKDLNLPVGQVYRTVQGRTGGGSWAHWQIALAYAKYLSNDFHRYVNEAFREWAEEKADPDLKVSRAVEGYRRKKWDDTRILARINGIVKRNQFTDTLKAHGVGIKGRVNGYALCTDTINKEVLGMTADELKRSRGLPAKAKTRDALESLELSALNFAESMATTKVGDSHAHGNDECCAVCESSGRAVRQAMIAMGVA